MGVFSRLNRKAEKVNKLLFLRKNLILLKKIDEKTVDQTSSTEMKRKIAEQSSFTLSHSNQEQFKRSTAIKKFKMGEEDDMVFQEPKLEPFFLSFANRNRNCGSGYFLEPLGSTLNTISSNNCSFLQFNLFVTIPFKR